MVAYVLPADANRTAIADGRRHVLLARPNTVRRHGGGHAGPGARVHLRTPRTGKRAQHYFPEALCAFSGVVTFSADGIVRVLEGEAAVWRLDFTAAALSDRGEGIQNLLAQAERGSAGDRTAAADRFAVAAGFKDYATLWASIRAADSEVIARQVIAWFMP